jgi:NAD+ diphosphatase
VTADLGLQRLAFSQGVGDRVAHRRSDRAWLAAAWANPQTRVLVVENGTMLVRDGRALVLVAPAEAPEGDRLLLGEDDGTVYFAVAGPLPEVGKEIGREVGREVGREGVRRAGLREVGHVLDDRDAGLAAHGVALANWHATHPRCARCGALTEVAAAGYLRRCPADGSEHFPRTDPAVIMAVIDPRDRILLGRQPAWPDRRFSTLAGFVEPGESLEAAVRREVLEEIGVRVGEVTYAGSQPWPFPSSLMVGFYARAETTDLVLDDEISEARWWRREELRTALAAGDVIMPTPISISRRLIEGWHCGPLDRP